MKKTLSFILVFVLVVSMSSIAMAATSAGKAAAPGQADNFSKGITTEVTYSAEVTVPHLSKETKSVSEIRQTATRLEQVVGAPVETSEIDWNTVIGSVTHPEFPWTAYLYPETVSVTTTTKNTQVDTMASFDVTYERTVSTYYLIKRTVQHRGAPNSNGLVLSDVSEEIVTRVVYGDWTEVAALEVSGTSYEVRNELADTVVTVSSHNTVKGEWIKPEGTPSTESQSGGAEPDSKGPKK
jgi:hypothetical protein